MRLSREVEKTERRLSAELRATQQAKAKAKKALAGHPRVGQEGLSCRAYFSLGRRRGSGRGRSEKPPREGAREEDAPQSPKATRSYPVATR